VDWLEQNLDAYRIIAEILNDLRRVVREQLESVHGKNWYTSGLPGGLLDRLIEIKEKEKAIDWYESEYQQIMDYAVFPDLLQILDHNSEGFPQIMRLAPTTALLHARFLELEVMRSKLGRARPISDTELAFLGTFHLRFQKAVEAFEVNPAAVPAAVGPEASATATEVLDADVEIADEPAPAPAPEQPADEPGPPRRRAKTSVETVPPGDDGQAAEPRRKSTDGATSAEQSAAAKVPEAAGKTDEPDVNSIDAALASRDDVGVLREIYREVTKTAEGIWTRDTLPSTKIWNKVSTSTWYEENFSRLGLKPISDYYEIMSKIDQQMREGCAKEELQGYLRGSNFAQILLALRDMFQRNDV